MNVEVVAGAFLIVAPVWFNATFALLGKRFDYPDILRRPPPRSSAIPRRGGVADPPVVDVHALGLLFIPAVVLLGQALGFTGVVPLAVTIGVLAGLVQILGLLRWVYLVPSLARTNADPALGSGDREANVAVFRAFHQYLGVGVGEHLGYLFTGMWSVLTGVAIVGTEVIPDLDGVGRGRPRCGTDGGSAEFLGRDEDDGWSLAGAAIPILYVAWSLWLLAMGVALIV